MAFATTMDYMIPGYSTASTGTQIGVWGSVLGAGAGAYLSIMQGRAQNRYMEAVAKQKEFQAKMIRKAAETERENMIYAARGEVEKIAEENMKLKGSQIATIAAAGGDISSQAAQNVVMETEDVAIQDISQINENLRRLSFQTTQNADIEALGLEGEAKAARKQGKAAKYGSYAQASLQLLQGYTSALLMTETYGTKIGNTVKPELKTTGKGISSSDLVSKGAYKGIPAYAVLLG